jgi:deferrochelatase/peroxidase EfeB
VNREMSSVPQDRTDSGGCPAGGFNRRSVLQGGAVAGLAAVGGNLLGRGAHPNGVAVETAAAGSAFPFYGAYQSGIITPPPDSRQPFSTYAAFDVTAANRGELTDLFRTLTARAAFLTAGGTAPSAPASSPPPDHGILGTQIPAAGTLTVIDPSSLKITATITVGDSPYGVAVSP